MENPWLEFPNWWDYLSCEVKIKDTVKTLLWSFQATKLALLGTFQFKVETQGQNAPQCKSDVFYNGHCQQRLTGMILCATAFYRVVASACQVLLSFPCFFKVQLRGHIATRSCFAGWQTGNTCRRGGGAPALMADSSALWSALHSHGTRTPLRDEKPALDSRGIRKVKIAVGLEEVGGGGRVFWWRRLVDRVVAPPPIFPSVACQSRLCFLSACLPASTICRSLLLPDTFSFLDWPRWETGCTLSKGLLSLVSFIFNLSIRMF